RDASENRDAYEFIVKAFTENSYASRLIRGRLGDGVGVTHRGLGSAGRNSVRGRGVIGLSRRLVGLSRRFVGLTGWLVGLPRRLVGRGWRCVGRLGQLLQE